ncbi:Uncharacterized protein APZ42_012959 [Daphnia magna]|uniref:Uncharacterized protein n=1 Tax=Daphnia magna TaxID=35525 RepID=A0A162RAZ2_9CRUS|nr:Uncharacterized protein APZ42_012959 [Daphnia magna]
MNGTRTYARSRQPRGRLHECGGKAKSIETVVWCRRNKKGRLKEDWDESRMKCCPFIKTQGRLQLHEC